MKVFFFLCFFFFVAQPMITDGPDSKIVAENSDVMFTCTATGSPVPVISWEHKGMVITHNTNEYTIGAPEIDSDDFRITSTLRLNAAKSSDSGRINCIVNPPPDIDTGSITLVKTSQTAQLSVLGT